MFLAKEDFYNQIRQLRFEQMTEDSTLVIEQASSEAVAVVRNYLFSLYDTEVIFTQTGSNRNTLVMLWCKNIAVFILHKRLPQAMIPPHVQVSYEDTLRMLDKVASGNMPVDLPPRKEDTNGDGVLDSNVTNFAWGSRPARSH
jgi:phage gp36-like protein